jgi:hypothetical protein
VLRSCDDRATRPDTGSRFRKPLRFLMVGGRFRWAIRGRHGVCWSGPFRVSGLRDLGDLYLLCIPAAFFTQRKLTFAGQEPRRGGFLVYAGMQVAASRSWHPSRRAS